MFIIGTVVRFVAATLCTGRQRRARRSCAGPPWWRCRSRRWRWDPTSWSSGTRGESPAATWSQMYVNVSGSSKRKPDDERTILNRSVMNECSVFFLPRVSSRLCSVWSSAGEWAAAQWRWRWTATACCWHKWLPGVLGLEHTVTIFNIQNFLSLTSRKSPKCTTVELLSILFIFLTWFLILILCGQDTEDIKTTNRICIQQKGKLLAD